MCTIFFLRNHTLEVDSVSQMYLPGCSFTLGLLQSLIASVTLSLPDNSAVSLNVQAGRLATRIIIWSIDLCMQKSKSNCTDMCFTKSKFLLTSF